MLINLAITTRKAEEIVDITESLKEEVRKSGVHDGVVCLYIPHTTCSVVVTEKTDPALKYDFLTVFKKILSGYQFKHVGGNGEAHLKSALMGISQYFIVAGGELVLGEWQGIYFLDFDGPRKRELLVKVMGQ